MQATTRMMTVEEFQNLPEDSGAVYQELRRGELVQVTRPNYKHYSIQRRLRRILEPLVPEGGLVDTEFPFRALPDHELRVADVAFVSAEREQSIPPSGYLNGAPELVIEVLSPSNTAIEIYEKEKLCLENGSKEFWLVNPDLRQVKVSSPDGRTITYRSGQVIAVALSAGASVSVDEIFG